MSKLMQEDSFGRYSGVPIDIHLAIVSEYTSISLIRVVYKVHRHTNSLAKCLYLSLAIAELACWEFWQSIQRSVNIAYRFQFFCGIRICKRKSSPRIFRSKHIHLIASIYIFLCRCNIIGQLYLWCSFLTKQAYLIWIAVF